MRKHFIKAVILLAVLLMAGMYACQKEQIQVQSQNEIIERTETNNPVHYPVWQAGNADIECGRIGEFAFGYKIEIEEGEEWLDFDGEFDIITITNSTRKRFDWSATNPIGAVIVKASTEANVWLYDPQVSFDENLFSPTNSTNGQLFDISHVTFCWNVVEEICWNKETAFGGNLAGPGNAWWFIFDATQGKPVTQNIYAGKELVEGANIKIENGTYTITPGPKLRLAAGVLESVKIQGYDCIENLKRRPAAGLFEYKSEELSDYVGVFNYYVIHLDVEVVVDCPEQEIE
jgi:hypothetical protein